MAYIKLDTKILDWEWYKDINTCRLFIHMLLKANWKEGRFKGEDIKRGSFASSYQKLSSETFLTIDEIRTAVKHLKLTGEITVKSHAKYSIFTITNYNAYQSNPEQIPGCSHSIPVLFPTIEESKELEEGKKYINYLTIIDLYNSICKSLPAVKKATESRKKAISARIRQGYSDNDFQRLFLAAENSDFLKGKNERNWNADFDWLMKDANMAKVLEGKYENRGGNQGARPEGNRKFEEVNAGMEF